MMPGFIDTHSHLHHQDFDDDREAVVARATAAGVNRIITLGTDVASSKAALALTEQFPPVFSAAGIHPSDAHLAKDGDVEKIKAIALSSPKVIAIGEIGLDFYWDATHHEAQYSIFGDMLRLAQALNMPVAIHSRSAHREMQWFFQEEKFFTINGVMHCFEGEIIDARFYLEMDLHISFTANITYKNFQYKDTLRYVPLDRVLIETDSPYMTPAQFRKQRNEPARVTAVAEKLAEIHNKSIEEVAEITSQNARRLFGWA